MRTVLSFRRLAGIFGFLLWLALVLAAGFLEFAWDTAQSYGLRPADGGVLRPLQERLLLGGLVGIVSLAFGGGMLLLADRIVVRIALGQDQVEIDTVGPFKRHRRRYPRSAITVRYHPGKPLWADPAHWPYLTLRIRGERLPFLISLQTVNQQNEMLDQDGLRPLLGDEVSDQLQQDLRLLRL